MPKTETWLSQGTLHTPEQLNDDLSNLMLQEHSFKVRCAVDEQTGRLLERVVKSAFSVISASKIAFYSGHVREEYTPVIKSSFSLA